MDSKALIKLIEFAQSQGKEPVVGQVELMKVNDDPFDWQTMLVDKAGIIKTTDDIWDCYKSLLQPESN